MEEKYFVNGGKFGRTWNQLLCWCDDLILVKVDERKWNWRLKQYVDENKWKRTHDNIEAFFNSFSHNPNDGVYCKGYNKQVVERYEYFTDDTGKERSRAVYKYVWVPPSFTPKTRYVTDSYGRIIPSGLIRSAYMNYKRNPEDSVNEPPRWKSKWRGRYDTYDHDRDFRKRPVPGIHSYKNGYWHKYAGDHCGYIGEMKAIHGLIADRREIFEEYGVQIRVSKRRIQELDPWGWRENKHSWKGSGWKRTRKAKQWMKGHVHLDTCLELTGTEM